MINRIRPHSKFRWWWQGKSIFIIFIYCVAWDLMCSMCRIISIYIAGRPLRIKSTLAPRSHYLKPNTSMSKYLLIVLVLLRFVAAANPCDGPCGPLNATIAACPPSDLMNCICNSVQFSSESQPCYNCYQAQGDTALAGQVQTLINLCGNGNVPNLSNTPAVTAETTPVTSTPSVSIPSVSTPTSMLTTTQAASSSTAAATTASTFKSDGSTRVVEYWKILGIVGVLMFGL